MKKSISLIVVIFIFAITKLYSNNLVISGSNYNHTTKKISFTISWENSWKVNSGPNNWDGVWVFVKRQACSGSNTWATALLSTNSNDHTVTSGTLLTIDAVSDGVGVFIKRASLGIGNITSHTIELALNSNLTTQPSITATANDNFKVFGTEMVYVPQGGFYLGDGRANNTTNFSAGNNASTALYIDATTQANGLGAATNYTSNPIYGCPGILPSTFPLGYNGFWCMKYEVSMVSYMEFMNCLNYDQQAVRLAKWDNRFPNVLNTNFGNSNLKGSLKVTTAGTYNTIPATFTNNITYNNYSPASFVGWKDLTAYLDWAGLRPMTEFEFEKACRGTANPVSEEFPWGNTLITNTFNTPALVGTENERANHSGEGLCLYGWSDENGAPYRSGYAATALTTRSQAGATFYGILDMGGNVFEQTVGGAGYDYSNFTTLNGDGVLGVNGEANTIGWPTNSGSGSGTMLKGGSFNGGTNLVYTVQVSDRTYHAGSTLNNGQTGASGGRGVRSY